MKRTTITKRARRVTVGKLPPRDDQEIDMAALITPEDIARAQAAARQYGSARFNALLDAERATNG